jgi:lipoate-protein ligase A
VGRVFTGVLKSIGVPAELVATGARPPSAKEVSSVCFIHLAAHEIMVHGKKIMGRATREKGPYRLEQGFLLLQNDYLALPDFLPKTGRAQSQELRCEIAGKTTSLYEILGKNIALDMLSNLLYNEIPKNIEGTWIQTELEQSDQERIRILMAQKYMDDQWLYKF